MRGLELAPRGRATLPLESAPRWWLLATVREDRELHQTRPPTRRDHSLRGQRPLDPVSPGDHSRSCRGSDTRPEFFDGVELWLDLGRRVLTHSIAPRVSRLVHPLDNGDRGYGSSRDLCSRLYPTAFDRSAYGQDRKRRCRSKRTRTAFRLW